MQQAMFDAGHQVGRLATERYAGGMLIREDHTRHAEAVRSTRDVMKNPAVPAIFEAAFSEDGVRIRADILERRPDGRWNLIEVKSSTGVKAEYLTDVGVQYHVLRRAGIDVVRVFLMHIDRDYVYDGSRLDLSRFLMLEELTADAVGLQDFVLENLGRLKAVLSSSVPPDIRPSRHCHQPHTCEFWEHCTCNAPGNWIFELSGLTQERFEALAADGIATIDQIPDTFPMTAVQQRIRGCVISSSEYIAPELGGALSNVTFPVHFLDFETIMPAIPRYSGTRPYQVIAFQWSDHILYPDGTLKHREFLSSEDEDPRQDFARTLIDVLGAVGTIFIYTPYEQRILRELAEQLPQFADDLASLRDRFVDLWAIIKAHYYHPAFRGSFSLKYVLPVLVAEMGYQDLAIQEGGMASQEYLRMIDELTPAPEKARIRENLLAYCGRDTLAMVKIREVLLKKTNRLLHASESK
jgi:hypothetical protein